MDSAPKPYPELDWSLLEKARHFYDGAGFKEISTPWCIPVKYSNYTKPHQDQSFVLSGERFANDPHELVGSAEQGFIYMLLTNCLANGQYSSITPCFRSEPAYDSFHFPWFMKMELFVANPLNPALELSEMLHCAFKFFKECTQGKLEIICLEDKTYDINLNGIEIGSYGIRKADQHTYVYGTGIAIPRFSIANTANTGNI